MSSAPNDGRHDERGREANWPSEIPLKGWKDIFWRLVREISQDRLMLVAAGAAFYLLLALFPALAAFVSLYGIVADPTAVTRQIQLLAGVIPAGGLRMVEDQLTALAMQPRDALSLGFLVSLALALWSANNGMKTVFEALNVAYEEREKRSFLRLHLITFGFTLSAIVIGMLIIALVGIIPAIFALFPLGGLLEILIRLLRWPLFLLLVWLGIAVIFRYGPSRERAKWRWITWGGVLATVVWFATSIGFSYYLENFANYNAVYGSLGAVVGFLMWMWISIMILLVGAEVNAEIEHQTTQDSTVGPERPMGQRGAYVADTLGKTAEEL